MSAKNSHAAKAARRAERQARKSTPADRVATQYRLLTTPFGLQKIFVPADYKPEEFQAEATLAYDDETYEITQDGETQEVGIREDG